MKLKYIFASIVATLALAVSCEKEAGNFLNEIKVSSSYLSFPAQGGDVTYTFTTSDVWEWALINTKDVKDEEGKTVKQPVAFPEWITASLMSGPAGENTVVLTATEASDTREATIAISCAGKKQRINIIQATAAAEPVIMSVSDVIAWAPGLADGSIPEQNVYVKGIVCRIDEISPSYGNATYYLSDDGSFKGSYGADGKSTDGANWFEVYRGYWLNGAKFTVGNEFSVGDEIIVSGLIMSYKGTPETKQNASEVYKYTPSLIGVDAFDFDVIPAEGLTFDMHVTSKVTPLLVSSDADWLTVTGVKTGDIFELTAAANDYTATRTATITIKAPGAVKTVSVSQEGIPATGASITEIVAMADASEVETLESTIIAVTSKGSLAWDGTTACYLYGDKAAAVKVGDNVKAWGTKKTYGGVPEIEVSKDNDAHKVEVISSGNAFTLPDAVDITADAATYTADKAQYIKLHGTLKVSGNYYNILLADFPEGEHQGSISNPVEELGAAAFDGKEVMITGWFNGISSGKYINVITTKIVEYEANPKGSESNPYMANELADLLLAGTTFEEAIYAKGVINKIDNVNLQYGNAQYWLSDDGSEAKLEVYRGFWFGGEKFTSEDQIKVGDEVVVYGKVKVYNGTTPEFDANNRIVSLNGVTQ